MAPTRADHYTEKGKAPEYYRDFLTDFSRNPVTGSLATVRNEQAIRQAIRNLVLTSPGERPKSSSKIGARIHKLLFEPLDSVTLDLLGQELMNTISKHEPRASVVDVRVQALSSPNGDETVVAATIVFFIQNATAPSTITIDLKRIR